ncbi:hypothetical protein [Saccharothrix syringae]|uniref:hypothetical protein n=1 Tax=Saccharothrix syringae TaxID=103733 RepID=UPI000527A0EC|nr:hypothetical protein [Saccharothrix syringae]
MERVDGVVLDPVSGAGLADLLVDDLYVRTAAGSSPATPFVLSALDGPTVGLHDFAKGMRPGGYARQFFGYDGFEFVAGGKLQLSHPNGEISNPALPEGDEVHVLPLVDPRTGQVYGQLYPYANSDPHSMVTVYRAVAANSANHYFRSRRTEDGGTLLEAIRKPWPVDAWQFAGHGNAEGFTFRMRTRRPGLGGDAFTLPGEHAAKVFYSSSIFKAAGRSLNGPFLLGACLVNTRDEQGNSQALRLRRKWNEDHSVEATFYAADAIVHSGRDGRYSVEDSTISRVRSANASPEPVERLPEFDHVLPPEDQEASVTHLAGAVSADLAESSDVAFTDLVDGRGVLVGVGFLTGREADIAREAFRNGAAEAVAPPRGGASRFFVAVHHDERGFHVPLKSGGVRVFDDHSFLRLPAVMGALRGGRTWLTLLSCSVQDTRALHGWASATGRSPQVESFPGKVELFRSGAVRLLPPDEVASPAGDDSVVLFGGPEPVDLGVAPSALAGFAFPSTPGDLERWRSIHTGLVPSSDHKPAVNVFVGFGSGAFLVRGAPVSPEALAAEVTRLENYSGVASTNRLLLLVDGVTGDEHVPVAFRFVAALRGDGPFRHVTTNTRPVPAPPPGGQVVLPPDGTRLLPQVQATDFEHESLVDAHRREVGLVFPYSDAAPPVESLWSLTDEGFQLVRVFDAATDEVVIAPWAGVITSGRARPFVLYLAAIDGRYRLSVGDDTSMGLTAEHVATVLTGNPLFRRFLDEPVRRPLILLTKELPSSDPAATPDVNTGLNERLLRKLFELSGPRPTYEYTGPLVAGHNAVAELRPDRIHPGPVPAPAEVVGVVRDHVFAFPPGAGPSALPDVVAALTGGHAAPVGPWGAAEPSAVVVVSGTTGFATVFTPDGRAIEMDGDQFGRSLLRDGDFTSRLLGHAGPVVLLADSAGSRVGFGGLGFDFAGALRAAGFFHDVYALAGGGPEVVAGAVVPQQGARFELVSVLRPGDVRKDVIRDRYGNVVAILLHYHLKERMEAVLRSWATGLRAVKVAQYEREAERVTARSPWMKDVVPLMLVAARREDGYEAVRGDGVTITLSPSELSAVLADDLDVREGAGNWSAVPFLLVAVDGSTVGAQEIADGMTAGGYLREVVYPDRGSMLFSDDGFLAVTEGKLVSAKPTQNAYPVTSHPLFDRNGVLIGENFPVRTMDRLFASAFAASGAMRDSDHYYLMREVGPGQEPLLTKARLPWADSPLLPWHAMVHGGSFGVTFSLRTGRPDRLGDLAPRSGVQAAATIVATDLFARASTVPGTPVVLESCDVAAPAEGDRVPETSALRQLLENFHRVPTPVYGATDVLTTDMAARVRMVRWPGQLTEALPPGAPLTPVVVVPELDPRDVTLVDLVDEVGGHVGVGFLDGRDAVIAREAFRGGAANGIPAGPPGGPRFFVAVHHDERGFHVPLKSGGVAVLDGYSFGRLFTAVNAVALPGPYLTLLSCSVADSLAISAHLERSNRRAHVQVFRNKVELYRSGTFREWPAGVTPPGSEDSVVLFGGWSSRAEFDAHAGAAGGIAFPTDRAQKSRWKDLHRRMARIPGLPAPVYTYLNSADDRFTFRGKPVEAARLAAELRSSRAYRKADPAAPVVLVVDGPARAGLVDAARHLAGELRVHDADRRVLLVAGPAGTGAGEVDVRRAGLRQVSPVRPDDVVWRPLHDARGAGYGVGFLADHRQSAALAATGPDITEHAFRMVTVNRRGGGFTAETPPWARAAGGRARPAVVYVQGDSRSFLVAARDGWAVALDPVAMATLLLANDFFRALVGGAVRPPLILVNQASPRAAVMTGLLGTELRRLIGPHPTYGYTGPFWLRNGVGLFTLPPGGRPVDIAPPLSLEQVLHRTSGAVLAFGSRGPGGAALDAVVAAVGGGAPVVGPWGDESPLLIAVESAERFATVYPPSGGGVELTGAELGLMLLADDGFTALLEAHRGPVVLLGERAGDRVAIGGLGFDFAGALRGKGFFHDVYALSGGGVRPAGGAVVPRRDAEFTSVSVPRAGDVRTEELLGPDGRVVALLVRSPGDDDRSRALRAWAAAVPPDGPLFQRSSDGAEVPRPWREGTTPVLFLATRVADGYGAVRADGAPVLLSDDDLADTLRDHGAVRAVAGSRSDDPLVFLALDDAAVDVGAWAAGMAESGYFREVHHLDGPVEPGAGGVLLVGGTGTWRTEAPVLGAEVISHPYLAPGDTRPGGQFFPLVPLDALHMASAWLREKRSNPSHYAVTRATGDDQRPGGTTQVSVRLPWARSTLPPWYVDGHGGEQHMTFRLGTGDPLVPGDVLRMGGKAAARVIASSAAYRRAALPAGTPLVLGVCRIGATPKDGGPSTAYLMREEFEQIRHSPTPLWAATQVMDHSVDSGIRTVHAGGRYVEALPPGAEQAPLEEVPVPTIVDASFVTLTDGGGGVAGLGFLVGRDAEILREAFGNGVARHFPDPGPRRFFVAVRQDDRGFHVPLHSGGAAVLDASAFMRLLLESGAVDGKAVVTFLSCSSPDLHGLDEVARQWGHTGRVDVYATGVELTSTGMFRVVPPDEVPRPSRNSLLLVAGRVSAGGGFLPDFEERV